MSTSTAIGTTTGVNTAGRVIDLLAVPYNETSKLTPDPAGERVRYGAFVAACKQPSRILLCRGHDNSRPLGRAIAAWEELDGLHCTFLVRPTASGDELLADVKDGFLTAASVGFRPTTVGRAKDGATIVLEADLREVSLVGVAAYDSARVLAVRRATQPSGHFTPRPVSPAPKPTSKRTSGIQVPTTGRLSLGTVRLW